MSRVLEYLSNELRIAKTRRAQTQEDITKLHESIERFCKNITEYTKDIENLELEIAQQEQLTCLGQQLRK